VKFLRRIILRLLDLKRLVEEEDLDIVARVVKTMKCQDCGAEVSKDIVSEDSVTYVCTNVDCGHRYEITGLKEVES